MTGTRVQSPAHHRKHAQATPGKANSGKGRAGNPQTTPLQLAEGFSKYSCLYKSSSQSGDLKRGKRWKFSKDHLCLLGTKKGQGL